MLPEEATLPSIDKATIGNLTYNIIYDHWGHY